MNITGATYIRSLHERGGFVAKMVFNECGALIFPSSQQHNTAKAPGISYEDNYEGNALAAMLMPGKIEIRYHKAFTDTQVTDLMRQLLASDELDFMRDWTATYQGRTLVLPAKEDH